VLELAPQDLFLYVMTTVTGLVFVLASKMRLMEGTL